MTPGAMRKIDFWVGIPLCFALTIVARLQRFFARKTAGDGKPRRILFVQLAEMGTMVVAYPALQKARELFPEATLHFLCFAEVRASVEMIGVIDDRDILTIDSRSVASLVLGTLRFLQDARRRRIDAVVNLESFVRFSSVLTFLSGAATRVGFHRFNQEGLYTGDLLTHNVIYNAHVHAGHTFLDLVHALATPAGQVPHVKRPIAGDRLEAPKLTVDPAVAQSVRAKLEAHGVAVDSVLVVVNPNASNRFPMRRLPLESFATLVKRLIEDTGAYVVLTGVADEIPDAREICERVNSPRVINLAGETTLTELLHLFDAARVVITNDSGPAHFASLTRAHVVVFFGPETPDRYGPLAASCDLVYTGFSCSPCIGPFNQRLSPCNDNLCLKSIDVGAVADLVRSRLASSNGPSELVGSPTPALV